MKLKQNPIKNNMNLGEETFYKQIKKHLQFEERLVKDIQFEPFQLEILDEQDEYPRFVYKPDFFIWFEGEEHPGIVELKGYNRQQEKYELTKESFALKYTLDTYGERRFSKYVGIEKKGEVFFENGMDWKNKSKEKKREQMEVIKEVGKGVLTLNSINKPKITPGFGEAIDFIVENYPFISSYRKKTQKKELKENISSIIEDIRYIHNNKKEEEKGIRKGMKLKEKLNEMIQY